MTVRRLFSPVVFFVFAIRTQNSSGTLLTLNQPGNDDDAARIENEVSNINAESKNIRFSAKLINLLTISYVDALGVRRSKQFLLWPSRGGQEIDDIDALQWHSRYQKNSVLLADISRVSGTLFDKRFDEALGGLVQQ